MHIGVDREPIIGTMCNEAFCIMQKYIDELQSFRCAQIRYASFEPKHLREYILPEGAREIRCCVDKTSGMICVSCTVDADAFSSFSMKNGYAFAKMETSCYLPSNDVMNELYPLRENLCGYVFANIEKSNVGETDMLEGVSIYDLERQRLYLAVCDKVKRDRVESSNNE